MDETEMKIVNYFQVLAIEAGVNEARLKNGRESAHLRRGAHHNVALQPGRSESHKT